MPESEIQQALSPLMRAVDKVDGRLERIEERINQLPSIYMTRSEYEPRHKALQDDIEKLEERLEKREEAAKAHFVAVICAFGGAILSIAASFILHFLK